VKKFEGEEFSADFSRFIKLHRGRSEV